MIKISIVSLIAIMVTGCTVESHPSGAGFGKFVWFWEDTNTSTASDCNDSKKDPFDVEEFKKLSNSIDEHREKVLSECKKSGFTGYAESKSDLLCSNGEIKDGCIVTSTGVMCGDVTFTSFQALR